ncbi:TPA_asm: phosphoheptose isomerase [Porphyromonas phage phage014a_Kyudai4]|uniref:Phosphoheptose isomerase n=4 Tax=root TaxID=1 RepID=A0AAT9JIS4_9VIRU
MPGAVDAMRALHRAGHYLIIWTCRYGDRLLDAVSALVAHGIPFDRINDHNPENIRQYGGEAGKKVYAHIYIDDKNLGGFPGWEVALKEISRVEDEYARRRKGLRAPVE